MADQKIEWQTVSDLNDDLCVKRKQLDNDIF